MQEIEDAARDMQNLAQHLAHLAQIEQGLASKTAKSFLQDVLRGGGDKVQDVLREGGDKVPSWIRQEFRTRLNKSWSDHVPVSLTISRSAVE